MSDDFQQTVNLRNQMKKKTPNKKAEGIDQIYEDEKQSLQKINKPKSKEGDGIIFKQMNYWRRKLIMG